MRCPSFFFLEPSRPPRALPSFPTRRSSDLLDSDSRLAVAQRVEHVDHRRPDRQLRHAVPRHHVRRDGADRKSTRLNSSHPSISYAVFCLKKKRTKEVRPKAFSEEIDQNNNV